MRVSEVVSPMMPTGRRRAELLLGPWIVPIVPPNAWRCEAVWVQGLMGRHGRDVEYLRMRMACWRRAQRCGIPMAGEANRRKHQATRLPPWAPPQHPSSQRNQKQMTQERRVCLLVWLRVHTSRRVTKMFSTLQPHPGRTAVRGKGQACSCLCERWYTRISDDVTLPVGHQPGQSLVTGRRARFA